MYKAFLQYYFYIQWRRNICVSVLLISFTENTFFITLLKIWGATGIAFKLVFSCFVHLSPSCPLYKSYTAWKIIFKLGSNVHLNKAIYRTYDSLGTAQCQGHIWRSNIKQYQGHWRWYESHVSIVRCIVLVCFIYNNSCPFVSFKLFHRNSWNI